MRWFRRHSKQGRPEFRLSTTQRNQLLDEFRTISSEIEVRPMMEHTIRAIRRVLPVEQASVFLVDNTLRGNAMGGDCNARFHKFPIQGYIAS